MDFHFPQVFEAIAAAVPDREAVVFRDRRLTYAALRDRSRRLARVLASRGLAGVETGEDPRGGNRVPAVDSVEQLGPYRLANRLSILLKSSTRY